MPTANDQRMTSYFASNPGKSVRDMYESLCPADFDSERALRVFIKSSHARATKLHDLGYLTRTESKDESGQVVFTYATVVAEVKLSAPRAPRQVNGYKARLAESIARWNEERIELKDGWEMSLEQRDTARAQVAELQAENARLWALLDTATKR